MPDNADLAVIGLAVMGQNLILNMSDTGFTVLAHNRTTSKIDDFLQGPAAQRDSIIGVYSLEELVSKLKSPRIIMFMVKAGPVVDEYVEKLLPLLSDGDIIIDGGNANFNDTIRRESYLKERGIKFVGMGISGGEEGARKGPSIMPGGNREAWPCIKEIYQKISAKTTDNTPCCEWVGESGSGHFVKMVHNGIEYGDMQLIGEAYHLMKSLLGMSPSEIGDVFAVWNRGELKSYLVEITAKVLLFKDDDGTPMIDKILDITGQKGTGKWTGISSLDLGVPVTLIAEAVYARSLSSFKDDRVVASKVLTGPDVAPVVKKEEFISDIGRALLAAKLVSYAQGFMLLQLASKEYDWHVDFGTIALLWREGCIIRSTFLNKIKEAYDREPHLRSLLLDDYFKEVITNNHSAWRRVISASVENGIPIPALSSGLAFYDGYRSEYLPANLLQAQRDYFGAHTFERVDKPRGEFFHINWMQKEEDE